MKILYKKADHKMLSGDSNNLNIYYKVAILNHKPLDSTVPVLFSSNDFNPFRYGGGSFRPHLSENRDFCRTEPPLDLRPVCKFKFVCCDPVEKNQSALPFSV